MMDQMKRGKSKFLQSPTILIVEDETIIAQDVKRMLENAGYTVVAIASSATMAIEKTEMFRPDLIMMDIILHGEMDGINAAHQIQTFRDIPIIFLTACSNVGTLEQMKSKYPFSYVLKPFLEHELLSEIDSVLEKYENTKKVKSACNSVELYKKFKALVYALSSAIELREPHVVGHQSRVSLLACAIANEMGLPIQQRENIEIAAIIHDLGKVGVPVSILNKSERLSKEEFAAVKTHPRFGYELLSNGELPQSVTDVILEHHERIDGSGYPEGLKASNIRYESKVVAVADVVEAMSSPRPYRSSYGLKSAMTEIIEHKNILYDSSIVNTCLCLFNENRFSFPDRMLISDVHKEGLNTISQIDDMTASYKDIL